MIADGLKSLAVDIDTVKLMEDNPRRGDVAAVKRSYATFGQVKPIVATPDMTVIAGNHSLIAARELGWSEIAVNVVPFDSEEAKAYALADNRTADLGTYDNEALVELLAEVAVDPELLLATGYSEADLEALIGEVNVEETAEPEDEPAPTSAPSKTMKGDIWLLGPHRIMCGDCREPTDVDTLLAGAQINLAFTSPPYAEQREYDKTSGFKPIPPDEYVEWFQMVQANVAAHLADDGSWFVNIKAASRGLDTELYVIDLVLAHAREWGWHFASEFCWERAGLPGKPTRRFKNQWEPVFHFATSEWRFRPENVQYPSEGVPTYSSSSLFARGLDVSQGKPRQWAHVGEGMAYPGNRLPTFLGSYESAGHGAAFPVGLPEFFVKAYTDEGDTVYDPFMGSGSTLLAAHNQNRVAYGMEISPAYCDIICKRFEQTTGITPIAEATGQPHTFID